MWGNECPLYYYGNVSADKTKCTEYRQNGNRSETKVNIKRTHEKNAKYQQFINNFKSIKQIHRYKSNFMFSLHNNYVMVNGVYENIKKFQ